MKKYLGALEEKNKIVRYVVVFSSKENVEISIIELSIIYNYNRSESQQTAVETL
jgi:hypothetical protein